MRRPRRRKANEREFQPNWLRLDGLRAFGDGTVEMHRGHREFQIPVATYPETEIPEAVCCLAGVYKRNGSPAVRYRDRRIEPMPTILMVHKQKFKCLSCGSIMFEPLPDLDENWYITHRFKHELAMASIKRTFKDAATRNGVDDTYVERIFDEYAAEKLKDYQVDLPRILGMDENHILGGMRFICANIETGQILEILPSRKESEVRDFMLEQHYKFSVEIVVHDMWRSYRNISRELFPKALNIIDKFHVVRMANDGMNEARKWYQSKLENEERKALKNRHLMFLARWDKAKPETQDVLDEIMKEHPFLYDAYLWKERFYMIYEEPTRRGAEKAYDYWARTMPDHIRPFFKKQTTAVGNWGKEIFNYFEHRVTNNMVENLNGRINAINQLAKGMKFHRFRAKALLRYGNIVPLADIAEFSGEPDNDTMISYGFDLATLEQDLRRGKF
ncbi:ISL3 family transposase [Agrobacterium sp. ST15.13.015]|uniref:ISL3 family transposase n=1 Tax=Agrobacterium sp. ST15.13.015 TaxID=3017319 RepID=UPI0022C8E1AF|nr:ISL3 family transposase [Agrobacterium sp. ST15.13.015]MCZ7501984.1 ISL3 family transposase [Rhizobium rhizogenes]